MDRYDAIVIGGGNNERIAAVCLAKSGATKLVLERRTIPGGNCIIEVISNAAQVGKLMRHIIVDLIRGDVRAADQMAVVIRERRKNNDAERIPFRNNRQMAPLPRRVAVAKLRALRAGVELTRSGMS